MFYLYNFVIIIIVIILIIIIIIIIKGRLIFLILAFCPPPLKNHETFVDSHLTNNKKPTL